MPPDKKNNKIALVSSVQDRKGEQVLGEVGFKKMKTLGFESLKTITHARIWNDIEEALDEREDGENEWHDGIFAIENEHDEECEIDPAKKAEEEAEEKERRDAIIKAFAVQDI